MILNFHIQNFGSVKDRQTLSFEADSSDHLEEHYITTINGTRILKLALIYGANASGKTTILKALDFLRRLALNPESKKTVEFDFKPFLFDAHTPAQNSVLSLEFFQHSVKYSYEVEFNRKAIVRERLDFYNPNKANVFKRETDLENQLSSITFGSKIKTDKTTEKILEANTLWNNTVLGGFLKTNIELKELKEVTDWFYQYLDTLILTGSQLTPFVTSNIDKGSISKDDVIRILKKADFNISDIIFREEIQEMPQELVEFFKKNINVEVVGDVSIQYNGEVRTVSPEFSHTIEGTDYTLPFDLESQGTIRYYGFAGLLALLIRNSVAFSIDELESSLHPDLYMHFLLSFLMNAERSQLIATTHNREILNNRDLFRDDAIWITDKGKTGSTSLYSLADFDSSVLRDSTNRLNAYKSGKLGGNPNLGDYYLNLNK